MKKLMLFVAAALLVSATALADIEPKSMTACKYNRAGTECEAAECAAFKINVTVTPHFLVMDGTYVSAGPDCLTADIPLEATLSIAEPGLYIIYLRLQDIPAKSLYSVYWLADFKYPLCGNYLGGDPTVPVNCDAEDEEWPAYNLLDRVR